MATTEQRLARAVIVASAMLFAAGLSCRPSAGPPSETESIAAEYPRVDGSTSTHPLSVLVACRIQQVPYEWRTPPALERTVFPSDSALPLVATAIEESVQHHGTHEAYVALIEDRADLILVARAPSEREKGAAGSGGVVFDVRPIALDALVFVVNVSNPVRGLSLDQVRAIFGPDRTGSWGAVGGNDSEIEPFQRETDSGSQELMEKLVMKGLPMRDAREVPRIYTMGGVVNTVAAHERGLAFSIYYYVTNMAPNERVKMLAIDGVAPGPETIASRAYPLTAEVHAVLRAGAPKESSAARLRNWLLTEEGQAAVRESGYVPIGRP